MRAQGGRSHGGACAYLARRDANQLGDRLALIQRGQLHFLEKILELPEVALLDRPARAAQLRKLGGALDVVDLCRLLLRHGHAIVLMSSAIQ